MEQLTKIVSEINGFLWGMYCLIPLLCGVGIYFTLKLDFIQIRAVSALPLSRHSAD